MFGRGDMHCEDGRRERREWSSVSNRDRGRGVEIETQGDTIQEK